VIEWALAPFLADAPRCEHIVVALAREDTGWEQVAARLNARARAPSRLFAAVRSAASRCASRSPGSRGEPGRMTGCCA